MHCTAIYSLHSLFGGVTSVVSFQLSTDCVRGALGTSAREGYILETMLLTSFLSFENMFIVVQFVIVRLNTNLSQI